ncbi:MAG: ATP-binding protein [Bacteroidales bacterium]
MPVNSRGERARLPLSTQVTPASREVNVDEELIIRVLLNLVQNSFESFDNPANAAIFLEAGTAKNGKTWIKITDNGPGIPPEIQDHIFVPFFTTKDGGNGIGLSLSKQIINMHKGSLSLNSVPGEGTSFTINI